MMEQSLIARAEPQNGSQSTSIASPVVALSNDANKVSALEVRYIQEVDMVREEMLAISRSARFVASRDTMVTDANGKIFAPGNRADKDVLDWIETVRKKIYDIAKKYNKPPREVLQQSQTMAKQSLDRSKRVPNGSIVPSNKHMLASHKRNENQKQDDVVIVAEMIKFNEGSSSVSPSSQRSLNLPVDDRLRKEVYNSSQTQLSNIDQIIHCIDLRVSKLRTCIADIQMGKSIEEASANHGIMKEVVKYEVDHELSLGEITFSDFQKSKLQPLKCLQYPMRLQEPEYWARLQSAVLSAAKKPLDTCLDTAKQHSIGLFHLLAALKEGFKKGRSRIEKEGQAAISPISTQYLSSHSTLNQSNTEQSDNSAPIVAVHPLNKVADQQGSSPRRKRDIRGVEVSSIATRIGHEVAQSFLPNSISSPMVQIPAGSLSSDLALVGDTPVNTVIHNQTNINHKMIEAQKPHPHKRTSDDDIIVIEQKRQDDDMISSAKNANQEQTSNRTAKPHRMICDVCMTRFENRKEYQSHVAAVCLDYDVL